MVPMEQQSQAANWWPWARPWYRALVNEEGEDMFGLMPRLLCNAYDHACHRQRPRPTW